MKMFNDHENNWVTTYGRLEYNDHFVKVNVHDDLINFYSSLIKKEYGINVNYPAHRGHITVIHPKFHGQVNHEFIKDHIHKYGNKVPFSYNTNILIGKGKTFFNFLLEVRSNELTYLRKNAGEIYDDNYHLTICNTKALPLETRKIMRNHIIYAGIGSRRTPPNVYEVLKNLGKRFAEYKFILRSGGATGADMAFEEGCDLANGYKEIILPWEGFEDNTSTLIPLDFIKEYELASKYHPRWDSLGPKAKKLIARNGNQILGMDLTTPVDFVVCYTPDGEASGGTGQGIRIAKDLGIPIFNLGKDGDADKLNSHITRLLTFT